MNENQYKSSKFMTTYETIRKSIKLNSYYVNPYKSMTCMKVIETNENQ